MLQEDLEAAKALFHANGDGLPADQIGNLCKVQLELSPGRFVIHHDLASRCSPVILWQTMRAEPVTDLCRALTSLPYVQ